MCSSIDGQGHDRFRALVALVKADGTSQQAVVPMQSLGLASPANNPSLLFGCHWWAKWNSYIWLESGPAGIWLELMVSSWFTKTAVYCISRFCLNWSPGECSCLCSARTQNAKALGREDNQEWTNLKSRSRVTFASPFAFHIKSLI